MSRHERKYTLPNHLAGDFAAGLRPAGWRQAHPSRHVNSLYFDGLTRPRYLENVEGLGWRNKIRIRWYKDFWGRIDEPILEVKLKAGHAGSKRRWPIPAFDLTTSTPRRTLSALPSAADAGTDELRQLDVVLATRYRRRYYTTRNQHLRLTVDDKVSYLRPPGPRGFTSVWHRDRDCVIELKYDVEHEPEAHRLAQNLGLRLTRNSKFAKGLAATRY